MLKLIQACKVLLDIHAPVRIELKDRIYKNSAGVHWALKLDNGKIKYHVIKVSLLQIEGTERNLETIIAHEFVHAWQAEHKPFRKKFHNPSFVKKAKYLEKALKGLGFELNSIYIREYDKS